MVLQNDTDELVIADRDLVQLDRVRWDNGKTFPDPDGASMSLRDPSLDNSIGANWCESTLPWLAGDRGSPGSASWCLSTGQQPIVIDEVMFDPEIPASERNSEWFEVTNLGADPVDMSGWTIVGGDMKTHTITSLTVAPGAHSVLAASGDPAANERHHGRLRLRHGRSLYNASGRVVLKSKAARSSTASSGARRPASPSLPVVPSASGCGVDNALGANWCESTTPFGAGDFGSPGAENSCELPLPPPAVVISEVMLQPSRRQRQLRRMVRGAQHHRGARQHRRLDDHRRHVGPSRDQGFTRRAGGRVHRAVATPISVATAEPRSPIRSALASC